MLPCSIHAWNNFVTWSNAASYEPGSSKHAAALAKLFMGLANNGGLNHFLTSTYNLDANKVVSALKQVGAIAAARQLEVVLESLGTPLPASTLDERENLLNAQWHDGLDEHDVLTDEADAELMAVLSTHVAANEEFYRCLD